MARWKQAKRQECPEDNVGHPRYGNAPVPSGYDVDLDTVRNNYWRYRSERIYPQTAIPADTARQNFTTFPRKYYVDIQKVCSDCTRPFIFFAREQKFWYETLRLYIDVDCVRCSQCRKSDQAIRRHREAFSRYIKHTPVDVRTLIELLEAGVYLWNAGELHNIHTLRKLKNIAHKELKTHPIREQLDALVASSISAEPSAEG